MNVRIKAEQVVGIIEQGLSSGWQDEAAYRHTMQSMIHDLGGANMPPECSLSAATNYLLMLWLARGEYVE
jgi:hypothetical protein